jgi:hypothetical protein
VADDGVQFQRAMRLVAMQKNGDRGDGDVGRAQRDQHKPPPGQIEQAELHQIPEIEHLLQRM